MSSLTENDKRALEVVSPVSPNLGENIDAAIDGGQAAAEATAAAALVAANGVSQMGFSKATYDFAVNGGAQGTIDLGVAIPANAVIKSLITQVVTPLASGGAATIAIEVGADEVLAATAYNDAGFDDANDWLSSPSTLAGGNIEVIIGAADLTAGKMLVVVEWFQGLA